MDGTSFSYEHGFNPLVGHTEGFVVVDESRGFSNPVAVCGKAEDAMAIVDALNERPLGAERVLNPSADRGAAFFNRDLFRAYQATGGQPGNPADILLAEIERRGLNL